MRLPLGVAGALLLSCVQGGTDDHRYKKGEHVELWVNTVGPYANPQEVYQYYTLPYCAPETKHHPESSGGTGRWNELKIHTMGEHLGGHALRHSGHDITFLQTNASPEKCTTKPLSEEEADHFAKAIRHRWFYQMYLDDLPVWGMVGEMLPKYPKAYNFSEDEVIIKLDPYVYTNRNLVISYNKDQIVKVDLSSDPKSLKEVKSGVTLDFSLHVQFVETQDEFHSRFDRYLDHEFFTRPWFSVFNSIIFLMGLTALMLLRRLKKGYASEKESLQDDNVEDSRWKQVHGDVFRAPAMLPFFAALVGSGWQLVVLTLGVILFAVLGPLHGAVHEERGKVMQAILIGYALSSIVSGFMSGKLFKEYRHRNNAGPANLWRTTMGLTVLMLPTVSVVIMMFLNTISLIYGALNRCPISVIFKLFLLWVYVSVPLSVIGTLLGRHHVNKGRANTFPCRVNAIPRPIPDDVPWYSKPSAMIPLAGLFGFGSIFTELNYVMASLWNYKFYHVYSYLLGVYVILSIVVGMTSIIVVYFCLNAENYLWQWTAFGSGASTGAYVFLYSIYYFVFETSMHGFLQTCFYFGYMTLIAITLGLLCGTIGHAAASRFVRAIFQNIEVG